MFNTQKTIQIITGKAPGEAAEKKVEYLELIYDLIFVYIIGRNNSLLHHIKGGFVDPGMFLTYVLCTLGVIQIWNFSTYYINLYGRNSLREHIFLFTNMFLLYFVAEGTRVHWRDYQTQYNVAWALILFNVGLQYLIERRHYEAGTCDRIRTTRMAAILFTEGVLVLFNALLLNVNGSSILAPIALLFGVIATMAAGQRGDDAKIDFAHLSERAMLYIVFTFGEMIIAISGYFEGKITVGAVYFALMGFLIVVGLFLSYGVLYDYIIDREQTTNGLGYIGVHILTIFSLSIISAALEFMRSEEVDLTAKILMIVTALILYYLSLLLLGRYAKEGSQPAKRSFVAMGTLSVVFIVLMLLLRTRMAVNIAVTVVYVFGIYLLMRRYKPQGS